MNKHWSNFYCGLPFLDKGRDEKGVDCWGLVKLAFKNELQIELPSYGEISATDLSNVSKNISSGKDDEVWNPLEIGEQKDFDVVVMKFYGSSRIGHVGLIVQRNKVLHVERNVNSVIVPLDHPMIKHRISCLRRHKDLMI